MSTETDTFPPPSSYEVPTLTDQLAGLQFSSAVRSAYWLGVSRAHARAIDDEMRRVPTEKIRAEYAQLRDEMVARAAGHLSDLKDALAAIARATQIRDTLAAQAEARLGLLKAALAMSTEPAP